MFRAVKQRIVLIVSLIIAGLVSLGVVLVAFQPLAPETASTATSGTNQTIFSLIQTIQIQNVAGRIDHLDVDVQGKRLFVAALGNNSVFVVDLASGSLTRSITGFNEPQGVAYIRETRSLFVSNGGNGTVDVIDTGTFSLVRTISFSSHILSSLAASNLACRVGGDFNKRTRNRKSHRGERIRNTSCCRRYRHLLRTEFEHQWTAKDLADSHNFEYVG